jgi:phosphate transport system substrate-binding protein
MNRILPFLLASVLLIPLLGCGGPGEKKVGTTLAGSTSVQPFAEKLAEIFMIKNPKIMVIVQGGGSSAGIQAVRSRSAQIGTSSRELVADEKDLFATVIAWDGIAVIVHPKNPLKNISPRDLKGIFAGTLTNWKELGWTDHPIHFITREEGSGTRNSFEELLMGKVPISDMALVQDSNGAVREIVAYDAYAIGYISQGLVDKRVQVLSVDGYAPSKANIQTKRYRLTRPFLFVTLGSPTGIAKQFVDFVLSQEGQLNLEEEGLVGVH